MSPIIYTPTTVTPDMVEIVLNEYKEHANIGRLDNAWWCARCPDPIPQGLTPAGHARSMTAAALQDALDKAVTADMVQLVLDMYSNHMVTVPSDDDDALGMCGECGAGIFGPHTIQAHAREMAANVLQDALGGAHE